MLIVIVILLSMRTFVNAQDAMASIVSPTIRNGAFAPTRANTRTLIVANIAVAVGAQRVELWVNDQLVESKNARGRKNANVVFMWTPKANGNYSIDVRMTDSSGRTTTAPTATLQVFGAEGPLGSTVQILEGAFRMGDNTLDDAKPEREIKLSAFAIDRYEVTVGEFRAFVKATNHKTNAEQEGKAREATWRNDDYGSRFDTPVRFVSWWDADKYCRWKGKRLPTEAEWERAARGTDGRRFAWGNNFDEANLSRNDTSRVGIIAVNVSPVGAFDLTGNVWEWVNDWYKPDAYGLPNSADNPRGPDTADERVIRGGSFTNMPDDLRVTKRIKNNPNSYHRDVGFRCAK
jgi:formylglycine-generating enzyme required for sulfatase activity